MHQTRSGTALRTYTACAIAVLVACAGLAAGAVVTRDAVLQQVGPVLALFSTCASVIALAEAGAARLTFAWLGWSVIGLVVACNFSVVGSPAAASTLTACTSALAALSLASVKER